MSKGGLVSLVRKLPSYRRLSISLAMAIIAIRKKVSWWNACVPVFLQVWWLLRSHRNPGLCFRSSGPRSLLELSPRSVQRDCRDCRDCRDRESSVCNLKCPKHRALLEDELGKMCARLQRELELTEFTKEKMFKKLRAADSAEKFIWCDAPAIRDCNWRRNTLGQGLQPESWKCDEVTLWKKKAQWRASLEKTWLREWIAQRRSSSQW